MTARDNGRRGVAILGSTGSVGTTALRVIDRHRDRFRVAALTAFSLVAQWWQARRHIAAWWLWIVVDVIYVGEYVYKHLLITSVLYAGFVLLAVIGLRAWRRVDKAPALT